MSRLIPVAGGLAFETPFNRDLVDALKTRIPSSSRRWDPAAKHWIVDAAYAAQCIELARVYLGDVLILPAQIPLPEASQTRILKLEYLGQCRDRGSESTASGYTNGSWSLVFPETVLRSYFEVIPQRPGERPTLYAVLMVTPKDDDVTIRAAYRRLARQWHPDVSKEIDSAEQFRAIQAAYEVLGQPLKRKKYDAGLKLQASLKDAQKSRYVPDHASYRAPLRCGMVMAGGKEALGRFTVQKIHQWQDIVDSSGRVMISTWPRGAEMFQVVWR